MATLEKASGPGDSALRRTGHTRAPAQEGGGSERRHQQQPAHSGACVPMTVRHSYASSLEKEERIFQPAVFFLLTKVCYTAMVYSMEVPVTQPARTRVFMSGRSQHVTIPREFRFRSSTVSIRRDPKNGDVILSEVPSLDEVFAALDAAKIPHDFLNDAERDRRPPEDRQALDALFDDETGTGKRK